MKKFLASLTVGLVVLCFSRAYAIRVDMPPGTGGSSSGGSSFDATADYNLTGAITHSGKQLTVNNTSFYVTGGGNAIFDGGSQNFITVIGPGNAANYIYFRSPASTDYGGIAFGSGLNPSSYLRYVPSNTGNFGPGYYFTGIVKDTFLDAKGLCVGCLASTATLTVAGTLEVQSTGSIAGLDVNGPLRASSATFIQTNGQGALTPPSFNSPTSSPTTGAIPVASTTSGRSGVEFVWMRPTCDQAGNCTFTINLASYTNITGPLNITSTNTLSAGNLTVASFSFVSIPSTYPFIVGSFSAGNSTMTIIGSSNTAAGLHKFSGFISSGTNFVTGAIPIPGNFSVTWSTITLSWVQFISTGIATQAQQYGISFATGGLTSDNQNLVFTSTKIFTVTPAVTKATGGEYNYTTPIPIPDLPLAPHITLYFHLFRCGGDAVDVDNSESIPRWVEFLVPVKF